MHQMTKLQTFILLLLVSFASIGSLAISPALPSISKHLGIFESDTQRIITMYILGIAVGQLFYGPLSNRFGRKPFIFLGIIISGLSALVGLFAASHELFPLLLASRFAMGLAGGACLKMSYNIAADLLTKSGLTKMISLFVLAFAIAPPVGIAIGGFLTQIWGWQSVFIFLFAYSSVVLYLSLELPETLPLKDITALQPNRILSGFRHTLSDRFVLLSGLLMGCGSSVIYLFATIAPFISIEMLGLKANTYGTLTMLANSGMIAAGLLGMNLSKKRTQLYVVFLGGGIFILGSLMLLIPFYFNHVGIWSLFLPMPIVFLGSSLAFTNSSSIGLSHAQDKSYASSMMSFINLSFTLIIIYIANRYPSTNVRVLPTILLSLSVLVLALWWRLRRLSQRFGTEDRERGDQG